MVAYPQYNKPGSNINPNTGKPYTPQEAAAVHAATLARDAAERAKSDEYRKLNAYYSTNGHLPTQFKQETQKRFGDVDDADASELGKQVALGQMTKEQAMEKLRQGYAVNDPVSLRAGLDVSAQLDPQLNAIERRRKTAKDTYDRGVEEDTRVTEANRKSVQALYEVLNQQMQQQAPKIEGMYGGVQGQLNQNTTDAQAKIAELYAQANSATQAQVAGMGGGQTQGQAKGGQDAAWLQSIMGLQNNAAQATLGGGKIGAMEVNEADRRYGLYEGTRSQVDMINQLTQRLAGLRGDYSNTDMELAGQYGDLDESRFAKLYEGKQSILEAQQQAQIEAEDREWERMLAEQKLGIEQSKLAIDQRKVDIMAQDSNAKLQADLRKTTPGTLEYEEIMAAIELKRAQTGKTLSDAEVNQQKAADDAAYKQGLLDKDSATETSKGYGKGLGGVENYLTAIGADGSTRDLVLKHVTNTQSYFKTYQEGLRGIEGWIAKHKPPTAVASAMRRATAIAYGVSV